jgi:hypothetical protein
MSTPIPWGVGGRYARATHHRWSLAAARAGEPGIPLHPVTRAEARMRASPRRLACRRSTASARSAITRARGQRIEISSLADRGALLPGLLSDIAD